MLPQYFCTWRRADVFVWPQPLIELPDVVDALALPATDLLLDLTCPLREVRREAQIGLVLLTRLIQPRI